MGAFGIWSLAAHRPHLYAALIPICGGFPNGNLPKSTTIHALKKMSTGLLGDKNRLELLNRLRHLPVWLFHGDMDTIVSVQGSLEVYHCLNGYHRSDVRITVFPNTKHSCWKKVYSNSEIFSFLLKYSLQTFAPGFHPEYLWPQQPHGCVFNRMSALPKQRRLHLTMRPPGS